MVLRVHNANASTQSRYANFTIPLAYVTANSLTDHIELGSGAIASKQWDDGQDAIYTVLDDWATGTGTDTMAAAGTPPDPKFALHAAYGESACGTITQLLSSVIPNVYATISGSDRLLNPTMRSMTPTIRIDGTLLKQYVWEEHFNGWHVYHAVNFYTEQALADVYTSVCWSDESYAADWKIACTGLKWVYGHEVLPKFLANEGFVRSNGNKTITLSTTFTNGSGSSDRYSWAGNMYHGRQLAVRGWMFGRTPGVTVPGDEDIFDVADHLDLNCSATEWEGYWQYQGAVGPVPQNPTAITRPDYATTNLHYVSWNRGTGGNTGSGGVGLVFARYGNSSALQGGLGLTAGGAVIHGYQRLYDYEAAIVDWALRPRYIKRDGTYPVPSTTPGQRFCLSSQYPHINSGTSYTDLNFGRNNARGTQNTSWILPNSDSTVDAMDAQHRTCTTLAAYYQLAKWDYFAYRLLKDWMVVETHNQRRGGAFALGSGMSGDREVGRCVFAAIQPAAACPELWPQARDVCLNPSGSYLTTLLENEFSPPPDGPVTTHSWWMFPGNIDGGNTPYTTSTGTYLNKAVDCIFQSVGTCGLWALWKMSGDIRIYNYYINAATTVFRDGTIYLPAGEPAWSAGDGAADNSGWTLPYEMRVNWDANGSTNGRGRRTSDAQRTFGHTDFGPTHAADDRTKIVYSVGGKALRRWGIGGAYLASRVHPDASVRARARNVYLTDGLGTGTANGWLQSYFIAAGSMPE